MLDIVASMGLKFEEFRTMDGITFRAYSAGAQRKKDQFSELLGLHLGSLLSKDFLVNYFFSPSEGGDVDDQKTEEAISSDKIFQPLSLQLKPELRDSLKDVAKKMMTMGDVFEAPVEIPGVDMDEAEFLRLQALSRQVDTARKVKEEQISDALQHYDPVVEKPLGIDGFREV